MGFEKLHFEIFNYIFFLQLSQSTCTVLVLKAFLSLSNVFVVLVRYQRSYSPYVVCLPYLVIMGSYVVSAVFSIMAAQFTYVHVLLQLSAPYVLMRQDNFLSQVIQPPLHAFPYPVCRITLVGVLM